MARNLFRAAFDHVEECATCCLERRRLCPDGALLFAAAYERCGALAGMAAGFADTGTPHKA